jgi:hypothetical protein
MSFKEFNDNLKSRNVRAKRMTSGEMWLDLGLRKQRSVERMAEAEIQASQAADQLEEDEVAF